MSTELKPRVYQFPLDHRDIRTVENFDEEFPPQFVRRVRDVQDRKPGMDPGLLVLAITWAMVFGLAFFQIYEEWGNL